MLRVSGDLTPGASDARPLRFYTEDLLTYAGTAWLASSHGAFQVRDLDAHYIPLEGLEEAIQIRAMARVGDEIWLGTQQGLFTMSVLDSSARRQLISHPAIHSGKGPLDVREIASLTSSVWVETSRGTCRIRGLATLCNDDLSVPASARLVGGTGDSAWLAGESKIYGFEGDQTVPDEYAWPKALAKFPPMAVYDAGGVTWFSTGVQGSPYGPLAYLERATEGAEVRFVEEVAGASIEAVISVVDVGSETWIVTPSAVLGRDLGGPWRVVQSSGQSSSFNGISVVGSELWIAQTTGALRSHSGDDKGLALLLEGLDDVKQVEEAPVGSWVRTDGALHLFQPGMELRAYARGLQVGSFVITYPEDPTRVIAAYACDVGCESGCWLPRTPPTVEVLDLAAATEPGDQVARNGGASAAAGGAFLTWARYVSLRVRDQHGNEVLVGPLWVISIRGFARSMPSWFWVLAGATIAGGLVWKSSFFRRVLGSYLESGHEKLQLFLSKSLPWVRGIALAGYVDDLRRLPVSAEAPEKAVDTVLWPFVRSISRPKPGRKVFFPVAPALVDNTVSSLLRRAAKGEAETQWRRRWSLPRLRSGARFLPVRLNLGTLGSLDDVHQWVKTFLKGQCEAGWEATLEVVLTHSSVLYVVVVRAGEEDSARKLLNPWFDALPRNSRAVVLVERADGELGAGWSLALSANIAETVVA